MVVIPALAKSRARPSPTPHQPPLPDITTATGPWASLPSTITTVRTARPGGPSAASGPRRQHHHHLAAFERGIGFDLGDGAGVVLDAVQQAEADFLMRHLASAEAQGHLDLVALLEEALHGLHLDVVVMIVDRRTELDLLD